MEESQGPTEEDRGRAKRVFLDLEALIFGQRAEAEEEGEITPRASRGAAECRPEAPTSMEHGLLVT